MPWYWYAIIVLSLGFVFASVCWYGAILGCGSAQATAEWERSQKDEALKLLNKALDDRDSAEKENKELKSDNCKMRKAIERQDTIIGDLKAKLAEAEKDRDEGWKRVSQIIGVVQKARA